MKNNNEELNTKIENLEGQLKKALADYINLERDMDKRLDIRAVQLKMSIARQLMDIVDASTLALQAKENIKLEGDALAWSDGVSVILSQIEKTFETLGIDKMIVNIGDTFDSSEHEALAMVNEGEKGKVHQVVAQGYKLGDYIVRPARVIVCNGAA